MLKFIALLTMLIDHIGAFIFPDIIVFRLIGRISFPIFAFFIAFGAKRTRDLDKYINRVLLFAIISQIPFVYAHPYIDFSGLTLGQKIIRPFLSGINPFIEPGFIYHPGLNIGFTFVLSLVAIKFIGISRKSPERKSRFFLSLIMVLAIVLVSFFLNMDYGAYGVAMVLIFYTYPIEEKYIFAKLLMILPLLVNLFSIIMQSLTLLSVPMIRKLQDYKPNLLPRWVFFAFYPLHLIVLGLIARSL